MSSVAADCDLHLTPLELSRYTSVFRLTYEFEAEARRVTRPGPGSLRLSRRPAGRSAQFPGLSAPSAARAAAVGLKRELDQRWTRNMMLNKWLEYCAERGHQF